MSIKSLLLWEKWRPETMDDIILLPRIKKHFDNGLTKNCIFYGNYGTGKTSLSRILIGYYTKDKPFLEINASLYTSIELLRNEIEDFCKFTPMMETDCEFKYVFLDEYDGVSAQFQEAFKAFIEKYSKNNVRFLMSTNESVKVGGGVKSRISKINFNCQNIEEEKYMKQEIYKRITKVILPAENKEVPKPTLGSIINKNFPDFRSMLVEIEDYLTTGEIGSNASSSVSNQIKLDLYNCICDKSLDYEKIYNFLMSNFGAEKISMMIDILGKPFIDWSMSEGKNIDKLFQCNYLVCKYSAMLESATDPIIIGMSLIGELKKIF